MKNFGKIRINIKLEDIFNSSKKDSKLMPLLKYNCGKELKNIFGSTEDINSEESDIIDSIIIYKINIINEIRKIITNKIEIIHIINDYLSKNDIYLFKIYIDLYLQLFFSINNDNEEENKINIGSKKELLKDIEIILIWFIDCGLLNKDIIDYVFQKIAKMQLEKTLTIDSFNIYLSLIEILYGKNSNNLKLDNIIAKKYIYFYNLNSSIIKTNISPLNPLKIKNGICIIVWFYLFEYCYNENSKTKGTIFQLITKDFQKIDIIINKDYDLDIKYNTSEILKEKNNSKFKLKTNTWIQLKIQFTENKIALYLNQNSKNNDEKKYKIKIFLINYEDKSKANKNININKIKNLKCNNFIIFYLNFFMGYEGLVGTILFFNDGNNDKNNEDIVINYASGLQNNKVSDFIKTLNLKKLYFIISPVFYNKEENKFVDSTKNIFSELSLEKNENNLNLNSVFEINNYTKNIFYIGGCNNILPLFEIAYKFANENDNPNNEDKSTENELRIYNILKNLFILLEIILINRKNNCIEAYRISTNFFESLQLLLENIDKKYFNKNRKENENDILKSLLNLGKYIYDIKNKKILESNEHNVFLKNILFYPPILMKFNSTQQNIIYSFFDIIKKENKLFKNTEYKTYFISFDKISKLLMLLSEKNNNEYMPSKLFNIIKIIFEDSNTTDNDRENLFLLYNNHLISDKIFINIMEIFIIFFDINTNIKKINKLLQNEEDNINNKNIEQEKIINIRNNSIKYFLYSSNFFIENLMKILLSKNLKIKKFTINFLRILTNKYNSLLEEYFSFVNEFNKNYKNKRMSKKEFFYFIKENIIINEHNEQIINEIENNKDKNEKKYKKKKRKNSIEDVVSWKKLDEMEDNVPQLERKKSLEIKFDKNQKKKIMLNFTKKKKKVKFRDNNFNINEMINTKRAISPKSKNNINKNSKIFYNLIQKKNKKLKNKNNNKEINLVISRPIIRKRSKSAINLTTEFIDEDYELNIMDPKDKEKVFGKKSVNINILFGDDYYETKLLKNNSPINNDKNEKDNKNEINENTKNNYKTINIKNSNINKKTGINNKKKKYKNRIHISKKQLTLINNIENIENEKKINNIKDVNINCDISMILYDWLVSFNYNRAINDNIKLEVDIIHHILKYIEKFLSNSTDLEVIYRTLFIILGQKSITDNNKNEYNIHYSNLLNIFSKSNSFRQLLEEIIIDSYLGYNNDKRINNKYNFNQNSSKFKSIDTKKDIFEKIYKLVKELLIDIYLFKYNHSKNLIIYEIYNIILKKYNGFQKSFIDNIFKLFNFLKNLFIEIINEYHKLLNKKNTNNENNKLNNENNINKDSNNNIKDNKNELINKKIYQNFIQLFSLFFEFSFIFKNYKKYISKKYYKDTNISSVFPKFLKEGMIFKLKSGINKIENWIVYDEYQSLIKDMKEIYDLKNIFKDFNLNVNELDKEDEVFHLEIDTIQKLVNELIFNKTMRNKYKDNIELLFLSYAEGGYLNNLPLINILSLYKCVFLNYENDTLVTQNLIRLLNDIQNFIISIILMSCNIKYNVTFSDKKLNYDDIQEIIYQNLLFLMKNIIYKYTKNSVNKGDNNINKIKEEIKTKENINEDEEDKEDSSDNSIDEDEEEYDSYFITIINNIFSVIGNIHTKDKNSANNSSSFLRWKKVKSNKEINTTGVNKLVDYFSKTVSSFINIDNLQYFSNSNNDESHYIIIQEKNNLYNNIIKNKNNKQSKIKSSIDLFNYKIFKSICIGRENEIKKKLKLILKSNQENNKFKRKKDNNKYKNLLIKIHFLQLHNENKNKIIDESRHEIFKIKNYRKIKKYLYSFNNSYSNLDAFYNKNKKYILTYKISNYLSGDKTRKLVVPVLDINYYLPKFRKFKSIDGKLFQNNIFNKIYKIDLKIIDKKRSIITPDNENNIYSIYNDICLVKTTHHIRGKIFHITEKEFSKKLKNFCFYFATDQNITKEYLLENCPDYDSVNNTCFGSTFINNTSQRDQEVYLKINFSDIIFIFLRKYCYRNNAVEIFLNNNKTYYFKFKTPNERDNFIEKLIYLLNHFSSNKKLFKKIKSIDENNKLIKLGYYRDIDNNKNYKTINEIKELWKNNKISSLEYVMWINIYGNRSFRDAAQYPVFPWILSDYTLNNVESIINLNAIRNFNLPMGMMAFDEQSNSRKEGYIEGYKLMVNEISEDINIKMPSENIEEDIEELRKKPISKSVNQQLFNDNDDDNKSNKSRNLDNEEENKLRIPKYKYDFDKVYFNLNIEYERIPYIFGTHYSNPMYVSHFLSRLFPYSFNMIEIQGDGFDCSDRLFFSLKSTFHSSTHEKCDLREIIPEFFTLPEIFLNINYLNFGQIKSKNYLLNINESKNEENKKDNDNNIINISSNNCSKDDKFVPINDVLLPPWTKQNPFYFIQIMKEIFEGGIQLQKKDKKFINFNPWIDIIFGAYQSGIKAQNKGNIFFAAAYEGVIDFRIKEENLLKNRNDNEFMIRFFEIGVNPKKVFQKKCKDNKKENNHQIINAKNKNNEWTLNEKDSIDLKISKLLFFKHSEKNELLFLDKDLIGFYFEYNEEENKDISSYYKTINQIKDFPSLEIQRKNIGYKIIVKSIFNELLYIITGYYDGSIYLVNINQKMNKRSDRSDYNISSELNSKENNILQTFGNNLITSLEIAKDEKYMICGNDKGVLIIYTLNYALFLENKKYIELLKIIKSHNNHRINSISINSNLFLFADCSYDGYVNLYTFPKINLINSLYINDNKMKKNEIDYVFLSSQPLPVIVLYSNKKCCFKIYSINGHELNYENNENNDYSLKEKLIQLYNNDSMINPITFTDYTFNEYLVYIFKYKCVLIRKFPDMKCHLIINCPNNQMNLTKLAISYDLENLYIYEESKNKIYIINNSIYKNDKNINFIKMKTQYK